MKPNRSRCRPWSGFQWPLVDKTRPASNPKSARLLAHPCRQHHAGTCTRMTSGPRQSRRNLWHPMAFHELPFAFRNQPLGRQSRFLCAVQNRQYPFGQWSRNDCRKSTEFHPLEGLPRIQNPLFQYRPGAQEMPAASDSPDPTIRDSADLFQQTSRDTRLPRIADIAAGKSPSRCEPVNGPRPWFCVPQPLSPLLPVCPDSARDGSRRMSARRNDLVSEPISMPPFQSQLRRPCRLSLLSPPATVALGKCAVIPSGNVTAERPVGGCHRLKLPGFPFPKERVRQNCFDAVSGLRV